MNQKEFSAFMDVVENTYPKQAKINNVQRGMFWLSLQKYSLDDCMSALLLHCETDDGEWKPQICHLTKFLKTALVNPVVFLLVNFLAKFTEESTLA